VMLPYGRQWIDEDDIAAVAEVLRSDWLTTGPWVDRFERRLAERVGARYAVAVSNGTAALHVACLAAGLGPGDLAITSPLTFVASANCALYCGASVTFADINPETRNVSLRSLDEALERARGGSGAACVVPVHYGGLPCDMTAIAARAREHGAHVIEDACHALGAEYQDETGAWVPVGSCRHSLMTVFSFHPVKHIATGEGGAVTTNDPDVYRRLLELRSHGISRAPEVIGPNAPGWYYEQHALGYNYRLTDIQAALGESQLAKLTRFVERRRELAARYDAALADLGHLVEVPPEPPGYRSAYHLYAVRLTAGRLRGGRRAVYDALRAAGLGVQVHYIPVHLQPYYRHRFGLRPGAYRGAEAYYEQTVSLPLYPRLTDNEHSRVVEVVRRVLLDLQTDNTDTTSRT
jgi:UDP-4-amino-4,6-dideoxy-N-acetyl-beta-L-altrosamine transaminase